MIDANKLIAYLEAWGEIMTTAKSRWAVGWVVRQVQRAVEDPAVLDTRPTDTKH